MKRKLIGKIALGSIITMLMVMCFAVSAFADEQRCDIQNCTKTVSTICDAKALVNELKEKGITCNLTVNCTSQEQLDYLKKELALVPMATIYRPVQLCLKQGNSASSNCTPVNPTQNQTNNNCEKKDTTCSKNTNNTNATNNNCNKTESNCVKTDNNCNNANNSQAVTDSNCSKTNTTENSTTNACNNTTKDLDASPKTGDSFGIRMVICLAVASLMTMIAVCVKKRRSTL